MAAAGNRGVDYLSVEVISALRLSRENPQLSIEKGLLFIYDKDFKFYLSKRYQSLKPLLEGALRKAKELGVIDKLIDKYWGDALRKLNLDARRTIYLKSP